MSLRYLLALAVLLLFVPALPGTAQNAPDVDTALSKNDATAMFAMDQASWNMNVVQAAAMGLAKAIGNAATGMGMATTHERGFLLVTPSYSSPEKPDSIQIMVGYQGEASTAMTDDNLHDVIEKAKIELAPEYDVTGDIDRFEDGAGVFFLVTRTK